MTVCPLLCFVSHIMQMLLLGSSLDLLLMINFIYLGLYVAFNTVQVISRRVVGRAEETSTYSSVLKTADQWQATTSFPT